MINKNKLEETINNENKINNKMKILVNDRNEINDNNNLEEIKEIICPFKFKIKYVREYLNFI